MCPSFWRWGTALHWRYSAVCVTSAVAEVGHSTALALQCSMRHQCCPRGGVQHCTGPTVQYASSVLSRRWGTTLHWRNSAVCVISAVPEVGHCTAPALQCSLRHQCCPESGPHTAHQCCAGGGPHTASSVLCWRWASLRHQCCAGDGLHTASSVLSWRWASHCVISAVLEVGLTPRHQCCAGGGPHTASLVLCWRWASHCVISAVLDVGPHTALGLNTCATESSTLYCTCFAESRLCYQSTRPCTREAQSMCLLTNSNSKSAN